MIEVVTGVLIKDGRIFLQQRRGDDKHAPFKWETPGGKVEGNESHHDALRREWREELGVWLGQLPELSFWCGEAGQDGNRGGVTVFLVAYRVPERHVASCGPIPQEGQGTGWFTRAQLLALRGSLNYGNEAMLDELVKIKELE